MTLTPALRKLVLTAHIACSVGWIGAVLAFLVLVIAAITNSDNQTLRAAWIALELIGWFAIVPLALGSLFTGVIIALGTKWGLFQHYWVLISLVLTILSILILIGNLQTVSTFAGLAASMNNANSEGLRGGLQSEFLHSGVGLLTLLVIQTLNIYKPRGLTPYGWRKQHRPSVLSQPEDFTT